MNYGEWTWEDTVIGLIFAVAVAIWTLGTVWGWW
jgi:hypothetical protein